MPAFARPRWNGTAWVGDIPDFPAASPPQEGKGAFIMTGEGVARLFAPGHEDAGDRWGIGGARTESVDCLGREGDKPST